MTEQVTQTNPHKGKTGLRRIWNALFYSLDGLRVAFIKESAFRQEVVLSIILLPLAFWLAQTGVQLALLVMAVLIVLIAELLNTGIEATVDRISFESHKLAKRAKDYGSAAVFISLMNFLAVWGAVLWEIYG